MGKERGKRGNSRSVLREFYPDLSRPNRSQVTIFIIIAILVVSAILVYFLWIGPTYVSQRTAGLKGFDGCVQDAIGGQLEMLGKQAGYLTPEFSYMYNGDNIGYLCYTNLYYKPCIVQQPFLKQHFEENLRRSIAEKINNCYSTSISDLRNRGYDVSPGAVKFTIELEPKQVVVNVEAPTSVSFDGSGGRFVNFDSKIPNPIYDMLMIATSILQYETKYGDSDVSTIMLYYPEFLIEKIKRGDGTTIYILTDRQSQTKFQFASRSYAWPPGYGSGTGLVGEQ